MRRGPEWQLFEGAAIECHRRLDADALRRWRQQWPCLREFASPARLMEWLTTRCRDLNADDRHLTALMNLVVADDLAGLALLVAIGPYVVAKARWLAVTIETEELVAVFVEQLWGIVAESQEPIDSAIRICERVRRRLRLMVRRDVDRQDQAAAPTRDGVAGPEEFDSLPTHRGQTAAGEELIEQVQWAVRTGVVSPEMAGLILSTRIEGVSCEELAAIEGIGTAAIRKRRRAAEAALCAA